MTPRAAHNAASKTPAAQLLAEAAAYWALTKKADDVVILDLRGRSDVCDFFVLASGSVDLQVRAIADAVRDGLQKQRQKPLSVEGLESGRWVLIDYVDVVVHVMLPAARQYYQLERLWGDAPRHELDEQFFVSSVVRARHPALPG